MSFHSLVTNFLEPLSLLIYFAAFWVYYPTNKNRAIKNLSTYYLLVALLQLFASLQSKLTDISNIWAYDLTAVLTAVFIGLYFHSLLKSKAKKKTVISCLAVYLFYFAIRQFTIEGARLFDSIGYSIISGSIAIYVFMYFHQLLQKVTNVNILKDFNFWLSSGYLVYFVGCFIIFVTYSYFTTEIIKSYTKQERALLTSLWGLHNLLLFISALSLLIGSLWISYRRKLELSS